MPPNATNLPNKAYPAPAPPFATTPFSVAARLCRNSSWSTSQYWCPWNPAEIDKELQLSSAPWKKPRAGISGASKKNVLNFVLPWKNPQLEPLEPPKKFWKGIWLIWTRPLWGAQQVGIFWSCNKGWFFTRTKCSRWYASVCEVRSFESPFTHDLRVWRQMEWFPTIGYYWAKMKDEINQIELMRSNVDRFSEVTCRILKRVSDADERRTKSLLPAGRYGFSTNRRHC